MAYITDAHVSIGLSVLMLAQMNIYAADPKMIMKAFNIVTPSLQYHESNHYISFGVFFLKTLWIRVIFINRLRFDTMAPRTARSSLNMKLIIHNWLIIVLRGSMFTGTMLHLLIQAEWHIYASVDWSTIGSDNGLAPNRRQTVI